MSHSLLLKYSQLNYAFALYHWHHFFGEQAHRLFYLFVWDAAEVTSGRQGIEVVVLARVVKYFDAFIRIA